MVDWRRGFGALGDDDEDPKNLSLDENERTHAQYLITNLNSVIHINHKVGNHNRRDTATSKLNRDS
jgi:hypothetical protein